MTIKLVTETDQDSARVIATLEDALARAKKGDVRQCVVAMDTGDSIHVLWAGSELRLLALTSRAAHILNRRTDQETGKG